jgi:threonine aldolase
LALLTPPWGATFCHRHAHIAEDECGAPEFYGHGAKLILVDGAHGRMAPADLDAAIARQKLGGVHGVQPAAVSITNVTEAGTVYSAAEVATLAAVAKAHGLAVHLDGARFANALVATGATAAEMTWKAGIDVVSFGGTKNGCMGVEAVVIFDPARAWEFELRRKRAGHLFSKHRFLSAQMAAYLEDGLWLRLATHANAMAARIERGLAQMPDVSLVHPVEANILFPEWAKGNHARLEAAGAAYYPFPAPEGRERARLVTSWSTTEADVDSFLQALRAG